MSQEENTAPVTGKPGETPKASVQQERNPLDETEVSVDQSETEQESEVVLEEDSLESLQADLDKALAKAEENWNHYLSSQAEIQNIRKRAERDLANAHKFALERFINELLPVKDSLEMGIAAVNETSDVAKLQEGSELTLKMLATAIEKFGVQEINPLGDKFNPELHEAMAMQPSQQAAPNTVLQVIQKGYTLNQRLVRPAMVIVAQTVQNV